MKYISTLETLWEIEYLLPNLAFETVYWLVSSHSSLPKVSELIGTAVISLLPQILNHITLFKQDTSNTCKQKTNTMIYK